MKKVIKAKKWMRAISTMAVIVSMVVGMALPVFAEDAEGASVVATSDDPSKSILKMTLGYQDDDGTYYPIQWGTCFMINEEYVLTNKHVVTVDEDTLEYLRKNIDSKLKANDKHIKLYAFVNRDMKVAATMHASVNSSDMDFAAVKLSEKIYDRQPVKLGDSDALGVKQPVYAVGFPADSLENKDYNTSKDVSTVDGTISKVTETGSVDIIEHTAPLTEGNSGGPLLDEDNNVVGVNTFVEGKKNYSIQINYIKSALDTFGIAYAGGDSDSASAVDDYVPMEEKDETMDETDTTAVRSELETALDDAKKIEGKGYTKESVAALDDCIGKAESVLGNADASESEIIGATDDLNQAVKNLEEKSGLSGLMIGIIIGAVVLIILVVVLVVVLSSKKKKNTAPITPSVMSAPMNQPSNGVGPTSFVDNGVGETSLLNSGAGETTLLVGGGNSAYLMRNKNGEKILINKAGFAIGKERLKVDYCVSDNTSVSRRHAVITRKGSDYYIQDQGATNGTFVNGVQLASHAEQLLTDKAIVQLSDEEFIFHLS